MKKIKAFISQNYAYIILAGLVFFLGWLFMVMWNWGLAIAFGTPKIGYWNSLIILLFIHIFYPKNMDKIIGN
ncbi:MAG: hypothetical protein WC476_00950 [Phycisphaerae bacterium]|jgi:ABC-type bacteriocin/lantibiotic exporter with double-glycine peptidase domain